MKRSEDHWMSISDIMSGLMMVFMFIAIAFMLQQQKTVQEYAEVKHEIYLALYEEFKSDLPQWNAEIDEKTLAITFKEPDILFSKGSAEITPQFAQVLDDFFPRYIKVLSNPKFDGQIEEIRIEGHTDPSWVGAKSRNEEYLRNMELSQARTRMVLNYAINMGSLQDNLEWMISRITANGLSSSQPIKKNDGSVDEDKSRRVEFRVRTNADEKMNELMIDGE